MRDKGNIKRSTIRKKRSRVGAVCATARMKNRGRLLTFRGVFISERYVIVLCVRGDTPEDIKFRRLALPSSPAFLVFPSPHDLSSVCHLPFVLLPVPQFLHARVGRTLWNLDTAQFCSMHDSFASPQTGEKLEEINGVTLSATAEAVPELLLAGDAE